MNLRFTLICASLASLASSFAPSQITGGSAATFLVSTTALEASGSSPSQTTRADFLANGLAAGLSTLVLSATASPDPAWAAADAALKGTKRDPVYEACVGQCMYECTKPKGEEQKSRQECLPECKKQCATSKAQLMVGTPLK